MDKTQGRKLDSATVNKTNEYNNTRGIRQQGDPLNDPDDAERALQRARRRSTRCRNVADWFGGVRGRRKAILFVSEGIDYDINDMIPEQGSNHQGASMVIDATRDAISARDRVQRRDLRHRSARPDGPGRRDDRRSGSFPDDTRSASASVLLLNEIRLSQDSLRTLSEETGGFAVVNRNDFATAFKRISRGQQLVLRPRLLPARSAPGRFHKIDVRVTRPGLTVRARAAYVTPKKVDRQRQQTTKSVTTPEVREALDSPLPVSGLTMHVFSAPFKGTAPNASVLMGVELRGRDLKLSPNRLAAAFVRRDRRQRQDQGRQYRLADDGGRSSRRPRRASSRPACGC